MFSATDNNHQLQRICKAMTYAVVSVMVFFSNLSLAEETTQQTPKLAQNPIGSAQLMDIGSGLIMVLVLIFGLAWAFRKFGGLTGLNRGAIQVTGGISLGPREKAVLLNVEGERILVGVAAGNVRTLHVLKPAPQNHDVEITSSEETEFSDGEKQDFADKLQQARETEKSS